MEYTFIKIEQSKNETKIFTYDEENKWQEIDLIYCNNPISHMDNQLIYYISKDYIVVYARIDEALLYKKQ